MQRTTTVSVGLLFVAAIGALFVLTQRSSKAPTASEIVSARASASAAPTPAAPVPSSSAAAPNVDASEPVVSSEGFDHFPDGGKVPELPATAPNRVGFGVVVFAYQGAQNAPRDARTREQALKKAEETIELARKDFAAAVAKGDPGSTSDAGHVPRGVLEAPIEYWLFSLAKGAVHDVPVDTPRGFWVLRRNE